MRFRKDETEQLEERVKELEAKLEAFETKLSTATDRRRLLFDQPNDPTELLLPNAITNGLIKPGTISGDKFTNPLEIRDGTANDHPATFGQIGRGAFYAYQNGAQAAWTPTSSSIKKCVFDTQRYDYEDAWSNTNDEFTAPIEGFYFFNWSYYGKSFASGNYFETRLYKNATLHAGGDSPTADTTGRWLRSIGSGLVHMNGTTDYVDLRCISNDSTARDLYTGASTCFLAGFLVKPGPVS